MDLMYICLLRNVHIKTTYSPHTALATLCYLFRRKLYSKNLYIPSVYEVELLVKSQIYDVTSIK